MQNQAEFRVKVFEVNGEKIEARCRFVDLYSAEIDVLFTDAPLYQKKAEVHARPAHEGEVVETPLDATQNTAREGDWIVTNPGGENYRVKKDVFVSAYVKKEDAKDVYLSLICVKAARASENLVFIADWGAEQAVLAGGYLVERADPLKPALRGERYAVAEQAFDGTYQAF